MTAVNSSSPAPWSQALTPSRKGKAPEDTPTARASREVSTAASTSTPTVSAWLKARAKVDREKREPGASRPAATAAR